MVVAVLASEVISLASLLGTLTVTDGLNINHQRVLHTHRGDHNYILNEKTVTSLICFTFLRLTFLERDVCSELHGAAKRHVSAAPPPLGSLALAAV